jgi:nucleoside 2-deoxyribosyltransferase
VPPTPATTESRSWKIYLAGPLFTAAERAFNAALAEALRQRGHEVFVPQEHEQRHAPAQQIFDRDVEGIDKAELVIACMDGPDPDSGTSWECGYAYRRKPIILFRTDFRSASEMGKSSYNLMLTQSASGDVLDLPFADLPAVVSSLQEALDKLPPPKGAGATGSR